MFCEKNPLLFCIICRIANSLSEWVHQYTYQKRNRPTKWAIHCNTNSMSTWNWQPLMSSVEIDIFKLKRIYHLLHFLSFNVCTFSITLWTLFNAKWGVFLIFVHYRFEMISKLIWMVILLISNNCTYGVRTTWVLFLTKEYIFCGLFLSFWKFRIQHLKFEICKV